MLPRLHPALRPVPRVLGRPVQARRFSSRFSEYMFQYGRMAQTNSPVVSVKGWFIHMQHYLYNQHLEADNPGLRLPQSLRGIPHSIDRVQIPTFSPSWHPTDAALTAAIDCGVQDAIQLLAYIGIDTNLSVQNGFFKQPCRATVETLPTQGSNIQCCNG